MLQFDCQERWVADVNEEFVDNFCLYDFVGHLVENNDNEGENEVDFDAIDIISEEDSSDESEENENGKKGDTKISD